MSPTSSGSGHDQTGHEGMSVWGKSEGGRQGRVRSGRLDVEIRILGAELSLATDTWQGESSVGLLADQEQVTILLWALVSFH